MLGTTSDFERITSHLLITHTLIDADFELANPKNKKHDPRFASDC